VEAPHSTVSHLLTKPFALDTLNAKVRSILGRR
jgi:DNA-binding response OmpR family regulator